jgi:hypothetical protein
MACGGRNLLPALPQAALNISAAAGLARAIRVGQSQVIGLYYRVFGPFIQVSGILNFV